VLITLVFLVRQGGGHWCGAVVASFRPQQGSKKLHIRGRIRIGGVIGVRGSLDMLIDAVFDIDQSGAILGKCTLQTLPSPALHLH